MVPVRQGIDANLRRLRGGQKLANSQENEKIVISGISGYFPNSDNAEHFIENLSNKIDLCDDDERRWKHIRDDIPRFSGKINNIDKFDCGFFGISKLQANNMDPLCRMLLERTIEAIMDAGLNPDELKGTNTGVFAAACYSEAEAHNICSKQISKKHSITGYLRSILPHRLSYVLQLNGPALMCDSACSSSLSSLDLAYLAIREGKCDMAIVCAAQLCTDPFTSLQFYRLGALNMNTGCKPFDNNANGYTRSEAIVAMILQKEKSSRRVYAKIIHSKTNNDGFKQHGITYPSGADQLKLLKDVYEECGINPSALAFIEAHGTGTKAGDPEELAAIDNLTNRNREHPLLIGSVKGNIGHTESSSGLCGITKVVLGMNLDCILPNIHYDNPRIDIPALMNGHLSVVTEKTKWPEFSELAGVNSFGFGGSNCHVVLERCGKKEKIEYDGIPRLVCVSGRSKQGVDRIQDYLTNNDLDYEYIRLIQEVFSKDVKNHLYRGYSILSPTKELKRSTCRKENNKTVLYLCLGGERIYNCSMLKDLQKLRPFKKTYKRFIAILEKNSILIQLDKDKADNFFQQVFLTAIIHVGIVDTFKTLNIAFNYVLGFSIGEITAAYANGTLTLEEVVTACCTLSKYFIKSAEQLPNNLEIAETNMEQFDLNRFNYETPEDFDFSSLNPHLVARPHPQFEASGIIVNVGFKCDVKASIIHLSVIDEMGTVENLLDCIGKLYEFGYTPSIANLYGEIKWPVSRGTPMLSNLIKWDHSKTFCVERHEQYIIDNVNEAVFKLNIDRQDMSFYKGHLIDGKTLFPATGYLFLVWKVFTDMYQQRRDVKRIVFEEVKFSRATILSKNDISFNVVISTEGYFELSEDNTTLASGRIYLAENINNTVIIKDTEVDVLPISQKDFYKELRLRGYQYKDDFKAVHQLIGNLGEIKWSGNWITFLDNMLQLSIFKEDTRALLVPTGIDRIVIDTQSFSEYVETLQSDKLIPCYINTTTNSIYANGIEIFGLRVSSISRKRQICKPVLESYKFVPNFVSTNISNSIRINTQIILENKTLSNLKIFERFDEDSDTLQPLSPGIIRVFEDTPLCQPEITLFTKKSLDIDIKDIQVSLTDDNLDNNYSVYIGSNVIRDGMILKSATIEDDGFIITVEKSEYSNDIPGFKILTCHTIGNKFIYLLTKSKIQDESVTINISKLENLENWLTNLKDNYTQTNKIILYTQNNNISGILGLTNCIRREPNGKNITCFFIRDDARAFDKTDSFYKDQIDKGMRVNVYQDGQWGTYRHLEYNPNIKIETKHLFATTAERGDITSFDWYQGNLSSKDDDICYIYYASVNFKDVLLASGKLPISKNKIEEGFEFSGRDKNGHRIMGIATGRTFSNLVQTKLTWKIPPCWSLEDAATIPIVYLTVLKAFHNVNLKHKPSILIHSGTGAIGQAALNICKYYNCKIFITVGNEEKRKYIMKHFPSIKPSHIGNSRNTTFEEMIFRETNGTGVDIILNSLANDKLYASLRCLAKGGSFIEIGKADLSTNARISADVLSNGGTYQSIMLDLDFNDELVTFFNGILNKPYIKPLPRRTFEMNDLQNSFRYMTTGKHMGKILIKIRDEETEPIICPLDQTYYALPKFYCDPNLSYIILGGLGGFGLELTNWLILRGARSLILSSRNGIVTGYQQNKIRNWMKCGTNIVISLDDITTYEGCKKLINTANSIAPVGGIFNLAVQLRDALIENITHLDFKTTLKSKAYATIYLDQLSKDLCPNLNQFVVFSSVTCGRGNVGQTNYGMANSIMERICEQRKKSGYPALAIQWGVIEDVGIVAEMQNKTKKIYTCGTMLQSTSSCLEELDKFLQQNEPVVSCFKIAQKLSGNTDNVAQAVLAILGITDLKSISLVSTLPELGMDSIMVVEIQQTLEREYDIYLSSNEIRKLTFNRLLNIKQSNETFTTSSKDICLGTDKLKCDEYSTGTYLKTIIEFTSNKDSSRKILLLPGREGTYTKLSTIISKLKYLTTCLQYSMKNKNVFEDLIEFYYPIAKETMMSSKTFNIVAYSMGGVLALKIASKLEKEGYIGKLVLIDSSPEYISQMLSTLNDLFDQHFEIKFLVNILENYVLPQKLKNITELLLKAKTLEERNEIILNILPDEPTAPKMYLYESIQNVLSLIVAFTQYKFSLEQKLKSKVMLYKPSRQMVRETPEDYCLSGYVEHLDVRTVDGDHLSVLQNIKMIDEINTFFED